MAKKKKTSKLRKEPENKRSIAIPFADGIFTPALQIAVGKSNSDLNLGFYTESQFEKDNQNERLLTIQALTNAGGVPTAIIEVVNHLSIPENQIVQLIINHYKSEIEKLQIEIEKLGNDNSYLKKMLTSKLFPEGKPVELNDTEKFIIEALQYETITGEKLAKKVGDDFNSHFKGILAALRRHSILGNKPYSGYFLEPAYHYLLNPEKQGQDKGQD